MYKRLIFDLQFLYSHKNLYKNHRFGNIVNDEHIYIV